MTWILFAQSQAAVGTDWTAILSSAVNIGFSVVVGLYLLTKAIPKMQEEHSKALVAVQAEHTKQVSEQRADFITELKDKRASFLHELENVSRESKEEIKERRSEYREALKAVTDHCDRESTRRDNMLQVEFRNLTAALEQQGHIFEELRDAIRSRDIN